MTPLGDSYLVHLSSVQVQFKNDNHHAILINYEILGLHALKIS